MASGHGAEMAIEVDPVGDPGVYTVVGALSSDTAPSYSRNAHERIAHNNDIDFHEQGILRRGELSISVFYDYDDAVHETLIGHLLAGTFFKLRFRGPGGLASTDETIYDGFLTGWSETDPVDGVRTAAGTYRPSGPFTRNGVVIGG